jgi:DNA invertase Pin-like site-specific DNA recombinase
MEVEATIQRDGDSPARPAEPTSAALAVNRQPVLGRARILIGYARCSTERQDLSAQRLALRDLGVTDDRVYLDHGLTGRNRSRPGLEKALAAAREGDTLVVPKLDRLARSIPDARAIGDSLVARGVRLSLSGTIYDPADPMGKCFFNILATFAEFELDLLSLRTRESMAVARANGRLRGTTQAQHPPARPRPQAPPSSRAQHRRNRRAVLSQPRHDLPHLGPSRHAGHRRPGQAHTTLLSSLTMAPRRATPTVHRERWFGRPGHPAERDRKPSL